MLSSNLLCVCDEWKTSWAHALVFCVRIRPVRQSMQMIKAFRGHLQGVREVFLR
jgi:hypothetical protein